jgi:hypothetical protein
VFGVLGGIDLSGVGQDPVDLLTDRRVAARRLVRGVGRHRGAVDRKHADRHQPRPRTERQHLRERLGQRVLVAGVGSPDTVRGYQPTESHRHFVSIDIKDFETEFLADPALVRAAAALSPVALWNAFLAICRQPAGPFSDHLVDGDELRFVSLPGSSRRPEGVVMLERRVGLLRADRDYVGTYLLVCRVWYPPGVTLVDTAIGLGEPGISIPAPHPDIDAFRQQVEGCLGFERFVLQPFTQAQLTAGFA